MRTAGVHLFNHNDMQSVASVTWRNPYAKNLNMSEEGLISVEGAGRIIEALSRLGAVGCLALRHNKLGDEGCVELLKYLRSEEGQRHEVAGILLDANNLGNVALDSIGGFLRGNKWLKELYLANNDFVGDSEIIGSFAEALNSSSLKFLSVNSCGGLSDAFAGWFFPRLDSPHLSNLQLSLTGLTRTAVPHIVQYLSSPRSHRLLTLKLNGNHFGPRGAAKIVRWINRANFNIVALEMYSARGPETSQGGQDDSNEGNSSDSSTAPHSTAVRFEDDLRRTLTRNEVLQRNTQAAAFRLLRYSRALLLKPRGANGSEGEADRDPFHIQSLPTELQLHILSLTVDTLSANQRIRVFQFASDPNTLPELLPDLRRRQSEAIPGPSNLLKKSSRPFTLSPRDENRTKWLRVVGCDLYET